MVNTPISNSTTVTNCQPIPSTVELSPQQVAKFHERGYLVVDFGFDELLLDNIKEKVYPYYPENFRINPTFTTRLHDVWLEVDEVRQLAVNRQVLAALNQLIGRRALPFQTLNFPIGTSQLPHSDTIHFSSIPSGYMAGVWVALEDIDEENGPLVYYPGSHKLPEFNMQNFGLSTGSDNYKYYEQCIQNLILENGFQPEYGTIKKGEALIWHSNLLHGGAPRKNQARTRHSQVTHYYFDGCEYFTPLLSSKEKTQYRDPIWIPESFTDVAQAKRMKHPSLVARVIRKLGFR